MQFSHRWLYFDSVKHQPKQPPQRPTSILQILAIGLIFIAVTISWFVLGGTLAKRSSTAEYRTQRSVTELWGPEQSQSHPKIQLIEKKAAEKEQHNNSMASTITEIQPISGKVNVALSYEPKKKGLTWSRTYLADFQSSYEISNPYDTTKDILVSFPLASENTSYNHFYFKLGEEDAKEAVPINGTITQTATLAAGETISLEVSYQSRGMDRWQYSLGNVSRIQNFQLAMSTNFADINFIDGSCSPTGRNFDEESDSWKLLWNYAAVINPENISMEMPKAKNPGPIAAKITFFAPVSLLSFFVVLLVAGLLKGINLHPVNYLFLAAGFFSFHLLFAYLVDILPLHLSFAIASLVSLSLIGSYIGAASGKQLMKIALAAQFAYLVLFSYSFLFTGITGLTLTLGAIVTLALLMLATAKVDWAEVLKPRKKADAPLAKKSTESKETTQVTSSPPPITS